ncbi:Uncharacterised protein [Vibrio cholerae]|nr:Uncharacterised protein [Vibrio cholerae]
MKFQAHLSHNTTNMIMLDDHIIYRLLEQGEIRGVF